MDVGTYVLLSFITAGMLIFSLYGLKRFVKPRRKKLFAALWLISLIAGMYLLANVKYVQTVEEVYIDTAFIVLPGNPVEVTLALKDIAFLQSNVTHDAFGLRIVDMTQNITLAEINPYTYAFIGNGSYYVTLSIAVGKPVLFQIINGYLAYIKVYTKIFRAGLLVLILSLLASIRTLAREKQKRYLRGKYFPSNLSPHVFLTCLVSLSKTNMV